MKKYWIIAILVVVEIVFLRTVNLGPFYSLKPFYDAVNNNFIILGVEFIGDSLFIEKFDFSGNFIQKRKINKLERIQINYYCRDNYNLIFDMNSYLLAQDNGNVIKFNKNIDIEWSITLNKDNGYDYFPGNNILKLPSGYIVCNQVTNNKECYIIVSMIDFKGEVLWRKEFKKNYLNIFDLVKTSDDDIFILAYMGYNKLIDKVEEIRSFNYFKRTGEDLDESLNPLVKEIRYGWSDIYLLKIDEKGNEIFSKTFGYVNQDVPVSFISLNENLIISYTVDNNYAVLLKVNDKGEIVLEKKFGKKFNAREYNNIEYLKEDYNGFWGIANYGYLVKFDDDFNEIKKISVKEVFEKNNISYYYTAYIENQKREETRIDGEYGLKFIGNDKLLYYKLDEDEKIIVKVIDLRGL